MSAEAPVRERASSADDLEGFEDLSSFDPRLSARANETDEQAAIDLIMGGEAFGVGDGTLELASRAPTRDLTARSTSAAARLAPHPPAQLRTLAEDDAPQSADRVARSAVSDALSRLESLAEGGASATPARGAPRASRVQTAERSELGADEGWSEDHGGVGEGFESEAPTPFALPKLPGSYGQPYTTPPDTLFNTAPGPSSVSAQTAGPAPGSPSRPQSAPSVPTPHRETLTAARPEAFAPFGSGSPGGSARSDTFDTGNTEMPSYARARERTPPHTAVVDSDLDEFLPPPEGPVAAGLPRQATREILHGSPGSPLDATPEGHFIDEQTPAHPVESSAGQPEPQISDAVGAHAPESAQAESTVASPRAGPSFFAQHRNVLLAVALGALLVIAKHFTSSSAPPAAARSVTRASPALTPIQHDYARAPIHASAAAPTPSPRVDRPAAAPVLEHERTAALLSAIDAKAAPASVPDPASQKQLAELTEQLRALASERDALRAQNLTLKHRAEPGRKSAKPVTVRSSALHPETIPAARTTPASGIQYLGTFRDAERLVAEVVIDGSLERVKRGDVVGTHRVDAVGDMSVTIDGTMYSP